MEEIKKFDKIMDIHDDVVIEENQNSKIVTDNFVNCSLLVKDDEEFKKYDKACKEYLEFDDLDEFYEGLEIKSKPFIHQPIINIPKQYEPNQWVIVGIKKCRSNKNKSTNGNKKPILCLKNHTECDKTHSFLEIPLCEDYNCSKIQFENNYYTGKCNKRHIFETFDNFVIRNKIHVKGRNLSCVFLQKPTKIFMKSLLQNVKNIGCKEFTIKISNDDVKTTLDEYYKNLEQKN